MLGKKGISPLIAAIILIAFVIAVAGIAGTFFTSFTQKQKVTVETKGGALIDCSVTRMEIDPDTISTTDTSVSFVVTNMGEEDISNLRVTVYNGTNVQTVDPDNTTLSKGESKKLTATLASVNGTTAYNIKLRTTDCPGVASIANKTSSGAWKLIG
ncbi:MAG: hypothetical protein J7K87_00620 [Candidatus Aenigmarchaeota archaeon]|nr:hypothetical protein [Candidatus Aenigmarchaeota archaeon]